MDNREYASELYHYGIKGQKWGIRRYQNPDGSLTEEGKKRYGHLGSQEEIDAAIKRDRARIDEENDAMSSLEPYLKSAEKRYNRKLNKYNKILSKSTGSERDEKRVNKAKLELQISEEKKKLIEQHIEDALEGIRNASIEDIKKSRKVISGQRFTDMVFGGAVLGAANGALKGLEGWQNYGAYYESKGNVDLSRYLKKHN